MKETIQACLSHPTLNEYVVEVFRQTDRFHVPTRRIYKAHYIDADKVRRLAKRFISMNVGIQNRMIEERIEFWNAKS